MERRPATPDEARALANPLRLRILRLCLDRELTNEELAARLGRDAGTVLHHVRLLVDAGFLAPAPERRGRRGAIERPYRATGKSWTLDVGESPSMTRAFVDAFRDEIAESPPADIALLSRLGVRLRPDARDAFERRLQALIDELKDADDPAGEPYGFFAGLHRRADGTAPG
jgi:DNA-binding transcriptional ArsR family regulator